MIPKCHMYEFVTVSCLCFWKDEAAVVGVEDGVLFARRVDLGLSSF